METQSVLNQTNQLISFEDLDFNEYSVELPDLQNIYSKVLTSDPSQFLDILDTHFWPEVKLGCEDKEGVQLFKEQNEAQQTTQEPKMELSQSCTSELTPKVNLKYRGQKNNKKKGKYCKRHDVVYKGLMRTIRRFLNEVYTQKFGSVSHVNHKGVSQEYKDNIIKLWKEEFGMLISEQPFEEADLSTWEIVSTLVTSSYSIPEKSTRLKSVILQVRKVMKSFSSQDYTKLLSIKEVQHFFKIFRDSGFLEQMLNAYPSMAESGEKTRQVVDSIIGSGDRYKILKFDQN